MCHLTIKHGGNGASPVTAGLARHPQHGVQHPACAQTQSVSTPMAFALKGAASIPASLAASAAGSAPSASFAAAVPRRRAAATGKVSFRGAAAAVAEDKRSISGAFVELREQGKVALVPFITAGDPDLATTAKALKILDAYGSDVIELGVPYSDPLADGPVIQAAATRVLAKGITFEDVISMVKEVIPELSCAIALFTYYNPILKRGIPNFMSIVKEAGVHGSGWYCCSSVFAFRVSVGRFLHKDSDSHSSSVLHLQTQCC